MLTSQSDIQVCVKTMSCCGVSRNSVCGGKKLSPDDMESKLHSRQIDADLKIERKKRQKQVRLLLLGAGESGMQ